MRRNCAMPEVAKGEGAASEEAGDEATGLGEIVEDRLLDGRLLLRQPKKGHRAGTDAVLLAAALPELGEGPLLDLGAGVGTVGLAAALAQPALRVTLLERDPDLAALARENAAANGMSDRVAVAEADIGAPAAEFAAALAAAGVSPGGYACVSLNPPFYAPGHTRASPVANRRGAHVADVGLGSWLRTARRMLRPDGGIAVIHQAQALPELLQALGAGFGAVDIRPVHGVASRPAIRILVTARLGSKRPAALLPALILNRDDGGFTAQSEAIHRGLAHLRPYQ